MTANELIATLVKCDGMSARISERQCKINQERCRRFAEVGLDKKNKQYGIAGIVDCIAPQTLACLKCERYI